MLKDLLREFIEKCKQYPNEPVINFLEIEKLIKEIIPEKLEEYSRGSAGWDDNDFFRARGYEEGWNDCIDRINYNIKKIVNTHN